MKTTAITISIVLVATVGLLIFKPYDAIPNPVTESNATTTEEMPAQPTTSPQVSAPIKNTPTDTTTYYTAAEVSGHASTQSCWSIVNGKVYDLTSWINRHPGGSSAIKRMCGVDGSEDFNDQHGGKGRPERELAAFYIGVLK